MSEFTALVGTEIPNLMKSCECNIDNYRVSFEYMGYDKVLNREISGSYCTTISASMQIENTLTGESISSMIDLLDIPVLMDTGYKVGKSYKQVLDIYKSASGWYVLPAKNAGGDGSSEEHYPTLEFKPRNGMGLNFKCKRQQIYIKVGKVKVNLGYFLKSITGKSYKELEILLGTNRYILNTLRNEPSTARTVEEVVKLFRGCRAKDISHKAEYIKMRLFDPNYIKLDPASRVRFKADSSFVSRALNKELASTIRVGDKVINEGTILTKQILEEIDNSKINTLKVSFNGKVYELKKYVFMQDRLTPEELFTAINMYACALDGFDKLGDLYDLSSRVLIRFNDLVLDNIRNNISKIVKDLTDKLTDTKGSDVNLFKEMSLISPVDRDALLRELRQSDNGATQQADTNNLIAYLSKETKVTSDYKNSAPEDMVKVQDSQRNRTDSIDSPESEKIGKVHQKAFHTKIDENGFLVTPYMVVKNGKVVGTEPVYVTAAQEKNCYVASWDEKFDKPKVEAYYNGTIQTVDKNLVSYKEYSPLQAASYARNLIPFPGFSNPKRLLMGSNHIKQSVDIVRSERPIVSTGVDSIIDVGYYTAKKILKDYYAEHELRLRNSGIQEEQFINLPISIESTSITRGFRTFIFKVTYSFIKGGRPNVKSESIAITVPFMQKTDKESVFTYKVNDKLFNKYQGDDIVIYNSGIDIEEKDIEFDVDYGEYKVDKKLFRKSLALGRNFLIAYKTFSSSTIDDAVTIRNGLVYEGCLKSVSLKEIRATLSNNERFKESFGFTNANIPRYMKSDGLPKIGIYLKPGSLIIGKFKQSCAESRNTTIPNNVKLDNNTSGEVVFADIVDDEAVVVLASINDAEAGDKMSGRYGNKGVIARVVPDEEMPFIEETGEIIDVCLNPLGIPSRMNIGQVLEVVLGMVGRRTGKYFVVSPFKDDALQFVKDKAKEANVKPYILVDGRTGLRIKRPVTCGMMYMLKAEHQVKKKMHAINIAKNLNATTLQPLKGKKNKGGQAFGEMESWCLQAMGCRKVLQDIYSLQSDDVSKTSKLRAQIAQNPYSVSLEGTNRNDLVVQALLRVMGVEIRNDKQGNYEFLPFKNSDIMGLYPSPLDVNNIDSLHDEKVFGTGYGYLAVSKERERWGWIKTCEYVNPFWVLKSEVPKMVIVEYRDYIKKSAQKEYQLSIRAASNRFLQDILEQKKYVLIEDGKIVVANKKFDKKVLTGVVAITEIFKHASLDDAKEYYKEEPGSARRYTPEQAKMYNSVVEWQDKGLTLQDLVLDTLPIMPQTFRPKFANDKRTNDIDGFYRMLFLHVREIQSKGNSSSIRGFYNTLIDFIGIGGSTKKNNFCSLLRTYFGKDKDPKGLVRTAILSKRVQLSGRSVIIPSQDPTMKLDEIGIPFLMATKMWELHLISLLKINSPITQYCENYLELNYEDIITAIASDNQSKFNNLVNTKRIDNKKLFFLVRKAIIEFIETRVVIFGRQPSLHKFSVRAYKAKVVYTRAIQLNPLVCKGYNADFDGDQMYVIGLITDEACQEAMEKMAPIVNVVNPKDGSSVLEHSQDIKLGCYFATMLYNNVTSVLDDERYNSAYAFGSIESLKDYVECSIIELQDLVDVTINGRRYLSTAGRILFNSLLPDGFTDKPFTNTLHIPNVNNEVYNELAFDGLIASSDKTMGTLTTDQAGNVVKDTRYKYYSLNNITTGYYNNSPKEVSMKIYQDILEFGFKYSDLSGITLSLEDFETNPELEDYKEQAKAIADRVNDAYTEGLITEEGRKETIVSIFKDLTNFCKGKTLNFMGRNNNLFIIKDSGARGNDNQIMQSVGLVGVSMKTLNEPLETPILNSYATGLTSQEVFLASYGAKMGVYSTQNETPKAGFSTRQAVFMTNGFKIVEDDCGKKDWSIEVKYTSPYKIIDSNGKVILESNMKSNTDINSKQLESFFIGKKLTSYDDYTKKILKNFLKSNKKLDSKCIEILFKNHVTEIEVDNEVYKIRYNIDSLYMSLFLYREARNLPHLAQGKFITKKTLEYIRQENPKTIDVRLMINCESVGGACRHCYGQKVDTLTYPEVGEFIGIESAQAIGEPAAQLVISLFHQGGVAGTSVSSGVQMFQSFLGGGVPSKDLKAIIAEQDGYVDIQTIGDNAVVSLGDKSYNVSSKLLTVKDGEYIKEGDTLTLGLLNPDKIGNATSNPLIIRKRQLALLDLYYKTFEQNNIKIFARHFEVLTRLQTSLLRVMHEENSNLKVGKVYELPEVLKELRDNPEAKVDYSFGISKQSDVVRHFSGPFAAIGYLDVCSQISELVTTQDIQQNSGMINSIFVGEDVYKGGHKLLKTPRFRNKQDNYKKKQIKETEKEDNISDLIEGIDLSSNSENSMLSLGPENLVFDFDVFDNNVEEDKDKINTSEMNFFK